MVRYWAQCQQRLQQSLRVPPRTGRSARHQRHPLQRIVDDDGEDNWPAHPARQNDIAEDYSHRSPRSPQAHTQLFE
jgi:hypothetical protein